MAKTTTQTTRMNGKRVRIVTRVTATGTSVKVSAAPVEEWLLQSSAVAALKKLPEYGKTFDLEGDFNAARRSAQESVKAKATGITPGAFDLRIYMDGGQLGLIEMKGKEGRLSVEQKARHADLMRLGFTRQAVVKADNQNDAASMCVDLVRGWLQK
jgi:hypothetical protein